MKQRLLQIASHLDMSVRGFESACELQRGNISNMSEGAAIGSDKLAKIIAKFPEISSEWLLTGKGSMLKIDAKELRLTLVCYDTLQVTNKQISKKIL